MRIAGTLADRLLGLVSPRVTAAALGPSTCWTTQCAPCINHRTLVRTCCIINDRYGCTPCAISSTC